MKTKLAFLFMVISSIAGSAEAKTKILFLGDSLTEGYNLSKEDAYPYLVEEILTKEGKDIECVNAGISGSTSASGPSRLKWHLKQKPQILVLALGANDGLRGLSNKDTKKNLKAVIEEAKKAGLKVLLVGMKMPPNFGAAYTAEYEQVFADLVKEERVAYLPFLLENVAGQKKLNLADGIHPNVEGHKVLAQTVLKYLRPLL